jgi:hypothetical protein
MVGNVAVKNDLSHVKEALLSYKEFLGFKTHLSAQAWVVNPRVRLVNEALLHLEILEDYITEIEGVG